MSDRSEWIQGIIDKLQDSLGSPEQKRTVLQAAADMERAFPGGDTPATVMLRRMFEVWVHHMRYLVPAQRADHNLPRTALRSDTEIASEHGLTSKAAIAAKQEQTAQARERRIQRAAEHIEAGWAPEDVICFVAARDEWETAKGRARMVAA